MPRLTSPVEKFPGYVTIPDFLNSQQVMAFENLSRQMDELRKSDKPITRTELDVLSLPVILAIVQDWQIVGIDGQPTIERFPLTPRLASAKFLAWLMGQISRVYVGEIEIPNA